MKRNAWLSASLPFITGANRRLVSGHSVVGFRFLLIFILLLTNLDSVCRADRVEPQTEPPAAPSDLFQMTKVSTVHLTFTSQQWAAMEPAGGAQFGGPGGFDPGAMVAMIVAPAFMRDGDLDHDGRLSRDEFHLLAGKWFSAWDKQSTGALNAQQLGDGLGTVVAPPGGAAVGPPRMNLQGAEGKRNGLASMMGIEFKYVHADLDLNDVTVRDVGVRYKGNGTYLESRGSLKRSLKVDVNRYVGKQQVAGVSTLNLHNNVTDASSMNEPLSYRLYRDAGVPAPRTGYARVFVTVPGKLDRQYIGLYSVVENVDKHFIPEHFANAGGALFKPVTPTLFEDLGDNWRAYNQTYDPKTKLTEAQKQRVIDLCKLVSHADDVMFATKLGDYIDLESFARYLSVTVFLCDLDGLLGPGQNFHIYLDPKTNRFSFIPWDQDHSFGQFKYSQEQREKLSIHRPWESDNRFLERVFKVEAFKKLYLDRLDGFNRGIFKPDRFHQQVDEVAAVIRPSVGEESAQRLSAFDRAVAGKSPSRLGDIPFLGGMGGAKPIKGFVDARSASLVEQVAGRSRGLTLQQADGFGPPGGRGGAGGPGGDNQFKGMLASVFIAALDADRNGEVTRAEFGDGFDKWFNAWKTESAEAVTSDQLRSGISRDLSPFRAGNRAGRGGRGGPPAPRQ